MDVLVANLASGRTVEASATAAGMSTATARRRLGEDGVRERIDQERAEIVRLTSDRLTALGSAAVTALAQLLASSNDSVRLGAVKTALDAAEKARSESVLERRLAEVERILADRATDESPRRILWGA